MNESVKNYEKELRKRLGLDIQFGDRVVDFKKPNTLRFTHGYGRGERGNRHIYWCSLYSTINDEVQYKFSASFKGIVSFNHTILSEIQTIDINQLSYVEAINHAFISWVRINNSILVSNHTVPVELKLAWVDVLNNHVTHLIERDVRPFLYDVSGNKEVTDYTINLSNQENPNLLIGLSRLNFKI